MSVGLPVKRLKWLIAVTACTLLTSACAPTMQHAKTPDAPTADSDPLEPFNRAMFGFNTFFDKIILRPITVGYRTVVPEQGRKGVDNFLENIYTPVVFVNSVLQADPQNSFATFWRFTLNTTFGLGGVIDFASSAGLHNRPADLGETFAFYGVKSGPYIVLPVIGPCDVRDAFGRLGDAFISPVNYINTPVSIALWSATAIDQRSVNMELIDGIYRSSLDPYTTFRSGYTQKRTADIRRAETGRDDALRKAAAQ